ncbi:hypothetical protein CHS0354_010028 [Potamilus streckersoni]|uniref:Uncharacterized protein n=1 Tax=Potamilus streckersoni TaxID=2493646 RepID=A0AAE0SCK6_9BIVA|nr:hypothetical protein CHS0354_010028 [Potamilus streckersoni]
MPLRRILTQDDIDEIKFMRGKVPVTEIAMHFKISNQRIYKIWHGEETPKIYKFRRDRELEQEKLNKEKIQAEIEDKIAKEFAERLKEIKDDDPIDQALVDQLPPSFKKPETGNF